MPLIRSACSRTTTLQQVENAHNIIRALAQRLHIIGAYYTQPTSLCNTSQCRQFVRRCNRVFLVCPIGWCIHATISSARDSYYKQQQPHSLSAACRRHQPSSHQTCVFISARQTSLSATMSTTTTTASPAADEHNNVRWIRDDLIPSLAASGKLQPTVADGNVVKHVDVEQLSLSESFMLTDCYRIRVTLAASNGGADKVLQLVVKVHDYDYAAHLRYASKGWNYLDSYNNYVFHR